LRTSLERRNIRSARDRIRHYLAVNVVADRRTAILPGTLKELAADLGLTHEALYRALARMQQDGVAEHRGGKLRLVAPSKGPDRG
jgi:CRP/FNR family transcriptional regulator, dissimilatory nitrate respiration regulator